MSKLDFRIMYLNDRISLLHAKIQRALEKYGYCSKYLQISLEIEREIAECSYELYKIDPNG